jgi:hypothetical protein
MCGLHSAWQQLLQVPKYAVSRVQGTKMMDRPKPLL